MRVRAAVLAVVSGVVLVATALLLWLRQDPVMITVRNETGGGLSALALSDEGLRTPLPALADGESITIQPRIGDGEGTLSLLDANRREYLVLGYFEGDPGGSATVVLTASTPTGLRGRVDDNTRYNSLGKHDLKRQE